MAQIEPVEFLWYNGEIKLGVNLRVYTLHPLFESDSRVKAEITDVDDNLLFTTIIAAKTIEEVAQQLNLKLKTVDNTKKLLTEIMEADAKDGLYEQEQIMYSEEEVLKLLINFSDERTFLKEDVAIQWFEQFKKK